MCMYPLTPSYYVCAHIRTYVCTVTYKHQHIFTYTHNIIRMYVTVSTVCVCVHTYKCMHTHTCTYIRTYTHINTCTHTCTYGTHAGQASSTNIHTHAHTHVLTYIHTCTIMRGRFLWCGEVCISLRHLTKYSCKLQAAKPLFPGV